jgi:hypothetical protein
MNSTCEAIFQSNNAHELVDFDNPLNPRSDSVRPVTRVREAGQTLRNLSGGVLWEHTSFVVSLGIVACLAVYCLAFTVLAIL